MVSAEKSECRSLEKNQQECKPKLASRSNICESFDVNESKITELNKVIDTIKKKGRIFSVTQSYHQIDDRTNSIIANSLSAKNDEASRLQIIRTRNKAASRKHRSKTKQLKHELILENLYLKSEVKLNHILKSSVEENVYFKVSSLTELLTALVAPQANTLLKSNNIYDLAQVPDIEQALPNLIPSEVCTSEASRENQINYLKGLIKLIKNVSL